MKVTFRAVLLGVLLALLGCTVLSLAANSDLTARATANDLTLQVLDQSSLAIDQQVRGLLLKADHHGRFTQSLLQARALRPDDRAGLVRYFLTFLESFPEMTGAFLGTEAGGECLGAYRADGGRLVVWELRKNPTGGRLEIREYERGDFPDRPSRVDPDGGRADSRARPWYADARRAGRQTWSRTYPFFLFGGVATVPGITCATPLYDGRELSGVLAIDIRLDRLCEFLRTLRVGTAGYAFVAEIHPDGTRHVIAHPDPLILLRTVPASEGGDRAELSPPEALGDPRVTAFLAEVPAAVGVARASQSAAVHFRAGGAGYLGTYHVLAGEGLPNWLVCTVVPDDEVLARARALRRQGALIGACVLLAAVLASFVVSRLFTRPLVRLVEEARAVGRFEVEARTPVPTVLAEVDQLVRATEQMKASLRSFGKYVPADLVRTLLADGVDARPGGECRVLTVFFCDLADFTALSEGLNPQELVEQLSEYFRAVTEEVAASGGTVDKFIGDAVMAFWGAPRHEPDHAAAACRCALGCQRRMVVLRAAWKARGKPLLFARIGLNTGPVVVGNIGSERRFNYTAIGDAVNLASRLEGLNKTYGTGICLSEETLRAAGKAAVARPLDRVAVKGKSTPTPVYELLDPSADGESALQRLIELHGRGLRHYYRREWETAIAAFEAVVRVRPGDGPAAEMLRRCRAFMHEPPGPDWDGAHRMESK
jgi:adenylate cyclase